MSRVLEERVLDAHPLAPQYRMVLLMIAREVPEGQTEVMVNRTALARSLDTRPDVVRLALVAGEEARVCQVLKSGRVAFEAYDTLLGEVKATRGNGHGAVLATPQPTIPEPRPSRPVPQDVLNEFARQRAAIYPETYVFERGRDHKWARDIASDLPMDEIRRRIAAYLSDPNPFYAECKHSWCTFVRNINRFGVAPSRPSRNHQDGATQRYIADLEERRRLSDG